MIINRAYRMLKEAQIIFKLKENPNAYILAVEGIFFALVMNLVNNNLNLFATRLGATDFQISLVTGLPQLVGMAVLLPAGILTDKMRNKRSMVVFALIFVSLVYAAMGFVPFMQTNRLFFFLLFLAISAAPFTIYNASWQAYFSDIMPIERRNSSLTLRSSAVFAVGIIMPFVTGALLASAQNDVQKLKYHQVFTWISCVILILQIMLLFKVKDNQKRSVNDKNTSGQKFSLAFFKQLLGNKSYIGFVSVALFFHITWQIDWSLFYIGQVKYLGLNERWLGYVNIVIALVQFLTIRFWSKVNERRGIQFSIIMGSAGLCFCPVIMIIASMLPPAIAPTAFLIGSSFAFIPFATISLNMFQCLLQVLPTNNKTLYISIYTLLIACSNAVMPIVGVRIYSAFGGDLRGLRLACVIIFFLRITSTILWTIRWKLTRRNTIG